MYLYVSASPKGSISKYLHIYLAKLRIHEGIAAEKEREAAANWLETRRSWKNRKKYMSQPETQTVDEGYYQTGNSLITWRSFVGAGLGAGLQVHASPPPRGGRITLEKADNHLIWEEAGGGDQEAAYSR
ncbi:MAG: hypothetical protein ACYC5F_09950 [Thermoleophilia bacterium]